MIGRMLASAPALARTFSFNTGSLNSGTGHHQKDHDHG